MLDLGAARIVEVAGDRRTHYEAVAELRNLASRFLNHQVLPYFEGSQSRLEQLAAAAEKLSGTERQHAIARIKMLRSLAMPCLGWCIPARSTICYRWRLR